MGAQARRSSVISCLFCASWLFSTMGGKGKGKSGGGSWVFVPASIFGSKGKFGKGKGKGKDKGKDQLKRAKPEQKVWVGGLTEEIGWKELKEHFDAVAATKWIEKMGKAKDTACVVYANAEDAANAIATLNGSTLGTATLECDVWEQKEWTPKAKEE